MKEERRPTPSMYEMKLLGIGELCFGDGQSCKTQGGRSSTFIFHKASSCREETEMVELVLGEVDGNVTGQLNVIWHCQELYNRTKAY